jgi:outer membrane protein W
MIRQAAAVILALLLSQVSLKAQSASFTVSAGSATIHKGPSTGSPVIGRAPRGAVLEVTRQLGSWVKVSWPEAEEGSGYVHVSKGSIGSGAVMPRESAPRSAAAAVNAEEPAADAQAAPLPTTYVAPPSHVVGLGARMGGSEFGFGATARAWSQKRLGVQFDLSRSSTTNATANERVTSTQFAPSVVVSFRDHMNENVWIRPYVGGGPSYNRSSLSALPGTGVSLSDSNWGLQTFGGGEFTFPAAPRLGVSADVGYQWVDPIFPGFEPDGFIFSISGHWYVK